jgi:hypothetical protein
MRSGVKPEVTCRPPHKGSGAWASLSGSLAPETLNLGKQPSSPPETGSPKPMQCGGRAPTPLPGRDDNRIIRCDCPSADEGTSFSTASQQYLDRASGARTWKL